MKPLTWSRKFFGSAVLAGVLLSSPAVGLAQDVAVDSRIQNLEQRLQEIQEDMRRSQQIQEDMRRFQEDMRRSAQIHRTSIQTPSQGEKTGNMVFFRGGGAWLTNNRGNEIFTDVNGTFGTGPENDGTSGWYVGGGLDLLMTKDVWGMMSNTAVKGEINVEFKRFESKVVAQAVPSTATTAIVTPGTPTVFFRKVQLTMLTVSISPKIMFMEGSRFQPWIIPIGLDFIVISPPSNDTTVLDIGGQFAVGAQYRLWKAFHVGVDGRFHLTTDQTDTVNNYGTVGGYVGIGF